MTAAALIDPTSAAIVVGGTLAATLLRSGLAEWRALATALRGLARPAFRFEWARGQLAPGVVAIQREGIYRAASAGVTDAELDRLFATLLERRSLSACLAEQRACQSARREARDAALRLLHSMGELAPVFGLAGTLVALGGSAAQADMPPDLTGAVATAVLTTLYGLLLAHLLIFPLAQWIERRGEGEEVEWRRLTDWLGDQLRQAMPEARLCEIGGHSDHIVQERAA